MTQALTANKARKSPRRTGKGESEIPRRRISSKELGRRMYLARESALIRPRWAAPLIQVSESTLEAMETGDKPFPFEAVQTLAKVYGTSLDRLYRDSAVFMAMFAQFRKHPRTLRAAEREATKLLNDLVGAELELEAVMGRIYTHKFPPVVPIGSGKNVAGQASTAAQSLRKWLGLGDNPIPEVVEMLEKGLHVRVFARRLPSYVAGLYAHDGLAGPCMLLNTAHPVTRLRQTAAHELGHFMSRRTEDHILPYNPTITSDSERFADTFGRCFITPESSMRDRFESIVGESQCLSRRHVILLADHFDVSREAMVKRLAEIRLVPDDSWEWFVDNGGITREHTVSVLGEVNGSEYLEPIHGIPPRLIGPLRKAWQDEILGDGEIRDLFHLDFDQWKQLLKCLQSK